MDPARPATREVDGRDGTEEAREAPPVVVIMVAHAPGPWFAESLDSLGAQSYSNLSVLVVDAGNDEALAPRVARQLPDAHVLRLDEPPGYSAAANAGAASVEGAAFLMFCHDDVRFEPNAIQVLVEESFRSNAGVVGPKLVEWDRPDRLLAVGAGCDKVATPSLLVERHELDQQQHDAIDDVFFAPGAALLIRTDLFEAIGGFDERIPDTGEDLELCWRVHLAGARVLVAPAAKVGHREAELERSSEPATAIRPRDRRRVASQLRTVANSYSRWHRLRVVPQLYALLVVEVVVSLLLARFGHVRDIVGGWRDARRGRGDRKRRRELVSSVRKVPDRDIRHLQIRGFDRLHSILVARRSDDRDALVATVGGDGLSSARSGSGLVAWLVVAVFLVIGSRSLLGGTIPAVGEFVEFPDDTSRFFQAWTSTYREVGAGSVAPAPSLLGALAGAVTLTFGSVELLRQVLILATLPLGAIGMWRLCSPIGSRRARIVGMVAYVAVPVASSSIAQGAWGALVVYSLAPWFFAVLARASRAAPFGDIGGDRGPGVPERPVTQHVITLGVFTALASLIAPFAAVLVLGVGVTLAIGGVVSGRGAGWYRVPLVGLGGVLVAVLLLSPWSLGVLSDTLGGLGGGAADASTRGAAFGAAQPSAWGGRLGTLDLVRFNSGPNEVGLAGIGLFVAAALALVLARDWRLSWAVRSWFVALGAWSLAWVGAQGWLVPSPRPEVPLAVAAVALSFAAALGMAAFEVDLPDYHFGWRQVAAVVAGAAFMVYLLPALRVSLDGTWGLPSDSFAAGIDGLAEQTDGPFRVLWIGDPAVLPLNGYDLAGTDTDDPDFGHNAFGVTYSGAAGVQDLFAVSGDGTDRLGAAMADALAGRTNRLGEALAPMGVRYLAVPDRRAPAPVVDQAEAPRPGVLESLDEQLDLARIETNPAITLYRNAAWSPVRAVLPSGDDGSEIPAGLPTALQIRDGYERFSGDLDDDVGVYVAADADPGWSLTVGAQQVEQHLAQDWSMVFQVGDGGSAVLRHEPESGYGALLVAQGIAWFVVIVAMARIRVSRDERHAARRAADAKDAT